MKKLLLTLLLLCGISYAGTPIENLEKLGIRLQKPAPQASNSFVSVKQAGSMIYVSGHISRKDGKPLAGRLGENIKTEEGKEIARTIAIDIISTLFYNNIDINKIRLVKVTSFVSSTPDFTEQHIVTNGASDLFLQVFEEDGKHARSAIGMASLPLGAAIEIELVAEIK